MRAFCIAYLVFLTILLVTRDPTQIIGFGEGLPWILKKLIPYSHVIAFTVLAVLATCVRWPAPRWAIVVGLIVYGGLAEFSQRFVPPRHPCWRDWGYDIMGIAAGAMLCWAIAAVAARFTRPRPAPSLAATAEPTDDWETLQNLLARSAPRRESWWG